MTWRGTQRTGQLTWRRTESLAAALGIGRGERVALVGAGGKSTALCRLFDELGGCGLRVLATTTTSIWERQVPAAAALVLTGDASAGSGKLAERWSAVYVACCRTAGGKLRGLVSEAVDRLAGCADVVLVEADGSRGLPLKAPAQHEPAIPIGTTLVVIVVGASCLGSPLDEQHVHRPELLAAWAGVGLGTLLSAADVAASLEHPEGYLSRVPAGARVLLFVNQAALQPGRVSDLAEQIVDRLGMRVVLGEARGGPLWVVERSG